MRHYAFNVGDYAAATLHLSDAEDLAYRRLLDAYYAREEPLPVDIGACCRLARATTPAARRAVETVLREFFDLQPDGWHQKRADAEIERQRMKSQSSRDAINHRWNRERQARAEVERQELEQRAEAIRTYNGRTTETDTDVVPPTNHEPRTTLKAKPTPQTPPVAAAPLPDWIPADAWAAFLETRRRLRAPPTPRAIELLQAKLAELMRSGHSPRAVLEQSVERGWRGLFAVKPDAQQQHSNRNAGRDEVAGGIWHEANHDRHDDRTIDGTAERVA